VDLLQTSLALAGLYIGATLFFGLVAGFFGLGLFNRRRGESL
jgi:CrcB protein